MCLYNIQGENPVSKKYISTRKQKLVQHLDKKATLWTFAFKFSHPLLHPLLCEKFCHLSFLRTFAGETFFKFERIEPSLNFVQQCHFSMKNCLNFAEYSICNTWHDMNFNLQIYTHITAGVMKTVPSEYTFLFKTISILWAKKGKKRDTFAQGIAFSASCFWSRFF